MNKFNYYIIKFVISLLYKNQLSKSLIDFLNFNKLKLFGKINCKNNFIFVFDISKSF